MNLTHRPILGFLAGLALGTSLSGCAYSSSETPRPLEPDYERTAAQHRAETNPPNSTEESAADIPEEDPRAPAVRSATSWGSK